jgi:diacylglycerol kinase
MIASQHNAWIHSTVTVLVVLVGGIIRLDRAEWCWIVFAIASVWITEALNTAFEFLADVTNKEFHPVVKQSKDVAAGAVLISAMAAVVIGIIVFYPHFAR